MTDARQQTFMASTEVHRQEPDGWEVRVSTSVNGSWTGVAKFADRIRAEIVARFLADELNRDSEVAWRRESIERFMR